jgi:signal transduction histidine kinase
MLEDPKSNGTQVSLLALLGALYQLRLRQVAQQFNIRLEESSSAHASRGTHTIPSSSPSKAASWLWMMRWIRPPIPSECVEPGERLSIWLASAMQEGRAALDSPRTATTQTSDLAEALRRVTEDGLIASPMAVTFSVVGDAREMHPIVRDEIYRIGYEAMRNACTHSGASRLEVELRYADELIN